MNEVTFNITAVMDERWVPQFCTFLKRMEQDGNIGHSELIGFYADGDGDFRPEFTIEGIEFEEVKSKNSKYLTTKLEFYDGWKVVMLQFVCRT